MRPVYPPFTSVHPDTGPDKRHLGVSALDPSAPSRDTQEARGVLGVHLTLWTPSTVLRKFSFSVVPDIPSLLSDQTSTLGHEPSTPPTLFPVTQTSFEEV